MRSKDKFNSIPDDTEILCINCNSIIPKSLVGIREMREDGKTCSCKYCEWIKRRGGIPNIANFESYEVEIMGRFIFNNKSNCLNDLLTELPNRTLSDLCTLYQSLNTQKEMFVNVNCNICDSVFSITPSIYLKQNNHFCSHDCYHKYRNEHMKKGTESPFYNRIKTQCSCCGKEIEVIPCDLNRTNQYGDSFNFCSRKCYSDFRKIYYKGDRCPSFHRIITDELRDKMRIASAKRSKSQDRLNTKPQKIVNDILDKNNILYSREYALKYYSIDNYLDVSELLIEVMGDYWHVNPLKYNEQNKINQIQKKQLTKDKQKYSYIKSHYNKEILYLWETDILNSPYLCELLINEYILNNGVLKNYHSFNYSVVDNKLYLNDNIIVPYQNLPLKEYSNYLIT